jgi:hypothetical protein
MTIGRMLTILGLVALLQLLIAPPAYAYLDPGTGSYIFQLLLAAFVGLAFVIKVFWARIKGFFAKIFTGDETRREQAPDD